MILRPWLWHLLHSRRFWWVVVCAPFLLTPLFYGMVNTWGAWKLDQTVADLKKRGLATTYEELMAMNPPAAVDLNRQGDFVTGAFLKFHEVLEGKGYDPANLQIGKSDPAKGMRLSARKFCGEPSGDERVLAARVLRDLEKGSIETDAFAAAIMHSEGIGYEMEKTAGGTIMMRMPYLSAFVRFQNVVDRACLRAAAGDGIGAMDDMAVFHRMLKLQTKQPQSMIGNAIRMGMISKFTFAVWDLAQAPALSDQDLMRLDGWAAEMDDDRPLVDSYRVELVSTASVWQQLFGQITTLRFEAMKWALDWKDPQDWWPGVQGWWWQVRPVGFIKGELAEALRRIDREMLHLPDGRLRETWSTGDAEMMGQRGNQAETIHTTVPYVEYRVEDSVYTATSALINRNLKTRAMVRLARVTLAIERFRRVELRNPETITELVPRFLRESPKDPRTGEPIRMETRKNDVVALIAPGKDPKTRVEWLISL